MKIHVSLLPGFDYLYRVAFNYYCKRIHTLLNEDKSEVLLDKTVRECEMLLLTVAFNDENLVRKQAENIRKYVKDRDLSYVVVDNSTHKEKRQRIKKVCDQMGVAYARVPNCLNQPVSLPFFFWGGCAHGAALDWAFKNIISVYRPKRFALLDHDIIPFKDIDMTARLGEDDFYGVARIRDGGWYLWPGYSIFNTEVALKANADFLPLYVNGHFLDTGGANYPCLYSKYDVNKVRFAPVKTIRIQKTEGLRESNDVYHLDCVQRVDGAWVNIINGSNCARIKGKEDMIAKFLPKIP